MKKATYQRSYLIQGLAGAMVINLALFGLLPGLIRMETRSNDLESLNVVNFTRIAPTPAQPPPKEKQQEKKEEPPKEKIHKIASHKQQRVPRKQLKLNMPAPDLDIDPRLSGGIPMISSPEPEAVADTGPDIDFNAIMDQNAVDTIPVPRFKKQPRYPYRAKRMGTQGKVKLRFLVDKDGNVSDITILASDPPGVFDESVINAVSSWKYAPGELMGRRVATFVTTSVVFALE